MPLSARRRIVVRAAAAAATVMLCVPLARAQDAATQPATATVDQLVAQLGDEQFRVREAARQKLAEMGPAAGEALREAVRSSDLDVAAAAEQILLELTRRGHAEPTLVTLDLRGATPDAVFAELARQAGTTIRPNPPDVLAGRGDPVDFKADAEPFWSAFRRACLQWHVRPDLLLYNPGIVLERDEEPFWANAPVAVSGPFLVAAEQVDATQRMDFGNPGGTQRVATITFRVLPEPRLDVPFQSMRVQADEVIDERGNRWDTRLSAFPGGATHGRRFAWPARTRLTRPPDGGDRLATFKGSLTVFVTTRSAEVVVDHPESAIGRPMTVDVGSETIGLEVERVWFEHNQWRVRVQAHRAGAPPQLWQQFIRPHWRVKLVDDRGRDWPYSAVAEQLTQLRDPDRAVIDMSFNSPDKPTGPQPAPPKLDATPIARIVWTVPVDAEGVPVKFEFKDLPLP